MPVTVAEWLTFEDSTEDRHELIDGRLVRVQGGTERHDLMVNALYDRLAPAWRARGCQVFQHNRKVVTAASDHRGFYPDLLIRCGSAPDRRFEDSPLWVFEVLSETNTLRDMQDKLLGYTSIPALQGYVVIDPEERTVVAYLRQGSAKEFILHDLSDGALTLAEATLDFAVLFDELDAQVTV